MTLIHASKAAKLLCCQPNHVYALAREGQFTRHYIGKRSYRLDKKEIIQFIQKNKVR